MFSITTRQDFLYNDAYRDDGLQLFRPTQIDDLCIQEKLKLLAEARSIAIDKMSMKDILLSFVLGVLNMAYMTILNPSLNKL